MPDQRLSPTSYAILGLLAIKPWSTYELTQQMNRAIRHVWPRAESNLYREPPRLVAAGFATADRRMVGRRPRTEYRITPAGRKALEAWLETPAAPTMLESETLLKVLFGDHTAPETLIVHLEAFAAEAESTEVPWRAVAQEYIEGRGPFPERTHVNVLYWVLLDRWARLRSEWARWAADQVRQWPDRHGPADRTAMIRVFEEALREGDPAAAGRRPRRPAARPRPR